MKPFYYLTLLICSLTAAKASAQCNIEKEDKSETINYTAGREEIYRNSDLENGFSIVHVNLTLLTQKADKNKIKFILIVSHSKSSYQTAVVPRSATFNFTNGGQLTIPADEQSDPINKGSTQINLCYFRVTLDIIKKLQENGIKDLIINDTRTNEKIVTYPYANILAEQINCLYKKYAE